MIKVEGHTRWQIPFLTVWAGQAFSLVGSKVAQFALVWWLTEMTGSATVLATATLVALIPEILLSPLAGVYVDRWNRRVVMLVADGLVALAALWLAYQFKIGTVQVWHVYAIMFVRSVAGSFHWPAMQASTSLMVPKEQLSRVAGLNQKTPVELEVHVKTAVHGRGNDKVIREYVVDCTTGTWGELIEFRINQLED